MRQHPSRPRITRCRIGRSRIGKSRIGSCRIVGWMLISLVLTGWLTSCWVRTPSLQWIERANKQIAEGHYTAAEAIYRHTMEKEPTNATPAIHLADLYTRWRRPQRGLKVLDEAVTRGADESLVTSLRLKLLEQDKAWTRLHSEARNRVSQAPNDEDAWRALTLAAMHQGDCARATESAIQWVNAATTTDEEARYYLALLTTDRDQLVQHAPALHRAADQCPDPLLACLGYALISQEEWSLALCPLRKAVRTETENPRAQVWLGESLSRSGLDSEAEVHLLEAVHLAPEDPLPWLILGTHYLDNGETSAAKNPLLNAQALDPTNPAPCLAILELKARTGAYAEMRTWADAALQRAPTDVEVWKAVARLYLTRHLIKDTYPLRATKGAVRLKPEDGEAQMLLGWTYLQMGRHHEAIDALEASVRLAPDSGEAHFLLGQTQRAIGDTWQAEKAFTRATDLGYFPDR